MTVPSPALNEDCIDQAIEASIEGSSRCLRLEISRIADSELHRNDPDLVVGHLEHDLVANGVTNAPR